MSLPALSRTTSLTCFALLLLLVPHGPGFSQAPAEPAPAPQPAPPPPPEPDADRKYDSVIELTIEDAVRMALENNLNLAIVRLDDDIRARELVVARSFFDPFFNLGASYAKNRDPSVSFFDLGAGGAAQGVTVSPSETLSYHAGLAGTSLTGTRYEVRVAQIERDRPRANQGGITFLNPVTSTEVSFLGRQPLLKGGWLEVNSAEIRIARNNSLVSKEQLELTAMNTIFQVEQAYWELAFAIRNLEAKTNAYAVARENVQNITLKRAVGTMAQIDVTTAESQTALRRVELENALQLRETTRDNLLLLINYSRDQSLKQEWEAGSARSSYGQVMVTCSTQPVLDLPSTDRGAALVSAFERRPEYRQLDLNVDSQQVRVDVARNALLPNVDLIGRWSQFGLEEDFSNSYNELDSGRYYDWEVGIELSIPLTNRGPRSRYRNSRDELRKLRLDKNELENQIVLEVDQALREIEFLRRKVAALDDRVRLQDELLRAERRKMDVGMSIAYTVSVIENDLVDNQAQALRAKADLQIAKANLQRVTGALLDRYRITVEGSVPNRQ